MITLFLIFIIKKIGTKQFLWYKIANTTETQVFLCITHKIDIIF